MLNSMRAMARTWIAGILIALLVISFAFFGINDVFGGGAPRGVAAVGERTITATEYRRAFDLEAQQIAEQTGRAPTAAEARGFGLDRQILGALIEQAVLDEHARELGLTVTDDQLAEALGAIEAFQDPVTGRYSADVALRRLAAARLTPVEFEADLRRDLRREQMISAMLAGLRPPSALSEARLRYLREERALSVVRIPPDLAPEIVPEDVTDADVDAFFTENGARYAEPERRAVTLVRFNLDDFAAQVRVDEDTLRALYETEKDRLAEPERRDLVQISTDDEAIAATVAERLAAGEDPAAVTTDLGLIEPAFYPAAARGDLLDAAAEDIVFGLEAGEVTAPIAGALTVDVWRVDAITPGGAPDFESLEPQLRAQAVEEAAANLLFPALDAFEAERDAGIALEDAAAIAQIPVFSLAPIDRGGLDASDARYAIIADAPELLERTFEQPEGLETELIDLDDAGFAALRVDAVVPSFTPALVEIRDRVRADAVRARQARALDDLAAEVAGRLEGGTAADAAAEELGETAAGAAVTLARGQTDALVSRRLSGLAFQAAIGETVSTPEPDGARVIARIDDITPAAPATEAELDAISAIVGQAVISDVSQLLVTGLQTEHPVRTNQQILDRALGLTGDQPE